MSHTDVSLKTRSKSENNKNLMLVLTIKWNTIQHIQGFRHMHNWFSHDKFETFRDVLCFHTNSESREQIVKGSHQNDKASKLHLCYLQGFGVMGWKCTDDLGDISATAEIRQQINTVLSNVLLLATYMNSLFRTGMPPLSHLTKKGLFKSTFCQRNYKAKMLSQWIQHYTVH